MSAPIHGLIAEFENADALLEAAAQARATGYRKLEAYAPFPITGLANAVGMRFNGMAPAVLLGGLLFAGGLYLAEVLWSLWLYPLNIGGRPDYSWPAFILPALEVTFLGAALAGLAALLVSCRLPKYYHPIFNAPGFERASVDGFFLYLGADDQLFERDRTRRLLETLGAERINEVAR